MLARMWVVTGESLYTVGENIDWCLIVEHSMAIVLKFRTELSQNLEIHY